MNKKGFILMETILVILIVSVSLITIFASYNIILNKMKKENRFDTSEYIFTTNYIKKYFKENGQTFTSATFNNAYNVINSNISNFYNISKAYVLNPNRSKNKYSDLDAYMIDYLKRLDDDKLLLVIEYKKEVKKTDGSIMKDTKGNSLKETYIASVEW